MVKLIGETQDLENMLYANTEIVDIEETAKYSILRRQNKQKIDIFERKGTTIKKSPTKIMRKKLGDKKDSKKILNDNTPEKKLFIIHKEDPSEVMNKKLQNQTFKPYNFIVQPTKEEVHRILI